MIKGLRFIIELGERNAASMTVSTFCTGNLQTSVPESSRRLVCDQIRRDETDETWEKRRLSVARTARTLGSDLAGALLFLLPHPLPQQLADVGQGVGFGGERPDRVAEAARLRLPETEA